MVESAEQAQSHIPYPQLFAPEAVNFDLTQEILTHSKGPHAQSELRGGRVTPIDLRRTPSEFTDDEILDSVAFHLGVDKKLLRPEPKGNDDKQGQEETFSKMNIALEEAHNYLEKVLGFQVAAPRISKTKDIVDLIRRTALYTDSYRKGLQDNASSCALVKVALAVFELQKKEAHTLHNEMDYIERFLTQPHESNDVLPLFYKHFAVQAEGPVSVMLSGVTPQCPARLSMRDKSEESQITKFLMKPEATAEAALKDAIGLRVELKKDRVEDALVSILNYIQKYLEASGVQIEDRNLLGPRRLEAFKQRKSEEVSQGEHIPAVTDTSPLSADSFRALKVTAKVKTFRNPEGVLIERPIEIQFVEPENKNENGLSSHAVYELKKQITVMTRLFGGCSETWLKERARKVAETEGYDREFVMNTIRGLQDAGFLMRMPKVPNKNVYAATDVYRRWLRVDGLITDMRIRDQVLHKLGNS